MTVTEQITYIQKTTEHINPPMQDIDSGEMTFRRPTGAAQSLGGLSVEAELRVSGTSAHVVWDKRKAHEEYANLIRAVEGPTSVKAVSIAQMSGSVRQLEKEYKNRTIIQRSNLYEDRTSGYQVKIAVMGGEAQGSEAIIQIDRVGSGSDSVETIRVEVLNPDPEEEGTIIWRQEGDQQLNTFKRYYAHGHYVEVPHLYPAQYFTEPIAIALDHHKPEEDQIAKRKAQRGYL